MSQDCTNFALLKMRWDGIINLLIMDPSEFKEYIQGASVALLDVRSPQEYASGHISGALNMNMYSSSFMEEVKKLDRVRKYALYCQSGGRSSMALKFMQSLGFVDVVHMDGGISAWESSNFPIITEGEI